MFSAPFRSLAWLLLATIIAAATPAVAASVKTGDGLSLDLSPAGRVTALAVGKVALPLKGEGGFALADFKHQPEPTNLVPNPGFEAGETGWRLGKGQAFDTAVAHTGRASVRLEVPGPTPAESTVEVFVPVKPNTRYRVGMWLRRDRVGVCGVYSSERDAQGGLSGKQGQVGVAIPKEDGVWLPLSWEILTAARTARLSLRGNIYRSTGTLWLDDFFVQEVSEGVYEPVSGRVTAAPGGLSFSGGLPERGVTLEATLKGDAECLRVDGVLRDTTGEDRALGLRFGLPLDLLGWTWFDELEDRQPIAADQAPYRNTYDCVSGIGKCSVYPWSAVSGPAAGLSLALPLSQGPRTFLLQHEEGRPELSLTFFYGLTAGAGNKEAAPFHFVLYAHDPRWGMRSALERYYHLFPEPFVKRPTFEGYLNYANLEVFDPKTHNLIVNRKPLPDAADWGEGYKFLFHVHGCYDFRQVPYDDPKRPPDDVVFSLLDKMIQEQKTATYVPYVPTSETVKKICLGPQGQIEYIGDTQYWRAQEGYNHTDKPGWGFNFRVNEDPGVSPFLAETSKAKAEAYDKTEHRPWDGTFTADAIEGYMANSAALNYRREHFRTSLPPLTFGKDNLQPAMVNDIWDFHEKAWWPLTSQYRIATYGNANGYEQTFTLPYVDVPMTEGSWDPRHPGRLDRYLRGMAHHKIWRYWHAWDAAGGYGDADPANVRLQLQRCLQYAIYPPVYCIEGATADLEQWRGEFRQYVPAIEELSTAGWEPVPYATATGGVVVERFGDPRRGMLHYTLRNESDQPVETVLTLQAQALGLAGKLVWRDILPGTPQFRPFPEQGLAAKLEAGRTLALWVGTPLQGAQGGFRLAAATLQKLERMYYQELTADDRDLWTRALASAEEGVKGPADRCLVLSGELQKQVLALERLATSKRGENPDLAKLAYRVATAASHAPAALLGITVEAPRLTPNATRGGAASLAWTVAAGGRQPSKTATTVLAPWAEVAAKSSAADSRASLFVPADPPRRLLPFLLRYAGEAGATPFTISVPVDLVLGSSVEVSLQPQRVFRGLDRKLVLTVSNRLDEAGTVRMKLAPPAKTTLDRTEVSLQLPARGTVQLPLLMTLQATTFLGGTRLGYTLTADNPRFNTAGTVEMIVSDPVPQLAVKRLTASPAIDGKLDDPAWQAAPLVPELHLLTNGGAATEKTAVWAAYDDRGLYVALRCEESQMDKLVAKWTDRGSPLYQDDDVELFVFAPGGKQVYQLAINANGTQSDNFGNKSDWRAAAARGEKGWTVEVFVPYAALGQAGPPPPGLPWGMQFGRQQKARAETTSWTKGPSFISKEGFGEIIFE